jgi:membrane associated rhomboid family serine protease
MHTNSEFDASVSESSEVSEKSKIYSSLFYSLCFVLILWIVHFIQWSLQSDFGKYGVLPREVKGLSGIFTAPLIHGDLDHLISNSLTLLILLFGLFYFYRTSSLTVIILTYLVSGLMVWVIGRRSYHIGASGIVYGLVAFIFFSGLFRRDKRSMALSLIVVFLYGGLVWGVLPIEPDISFESHLSGALIGVGLAFAFRNYDPPEKYEWEETDEDDGLDYGDTPEKIDEIDKLFDNDDDDENKRLLR